MRDLKRVRQARPEQVTLVVQEYLSFVHQSSKRRAVHDAVAITLVFAPRRRLSLKVAPTA